MNTVTPASPTPRDNTIVNDLLRQLNDATTTPGVSGGSSAVSISSDQLTALLQCFKQQQEAIATMTATISSQNQGVNLPATTSRISGPPSLHTNKHTTKAPEYYNNAKYEDIGLARRSEGVHTVDVRT
jgi:hypothetical protein